MDQDVGESETRRKSRPQSDSGNQEPGPSERGHPVDIRVKRFEVIVKYQDSSFGENAYLIFDASNREGVIVDPGSRSSELENFVEEENIRIHAVLNTHGHVDHIGANGYYRKKYGVKVYAHRHDAPFYAKSAAENKPTDFLETEKSISFGAIELKVLHTPGHSPGSVCFLANGHLLTGDTLFQGTVGRTWTDETGTAEEKTAQLIKNIKRELLTLPDDTKVYPGHEAVTSIGTEKKDNPYLR